MKNAVIAWLIARFSEHSSVVGLGAIVTGGWQFYGTMQDVVCKVAANPDCVHAKATASLMMIGGAIAFLTKDGDIATTFSKVLATLGVNKK